MTDQLRSLRVFLAVADQQGFAPAARRLGMSTSAVSRYVADLERFYGAQLFHRTTRQVVLTDAGTRLRARATPLVEELDALSNEMSDLSEVPRGHLRLSAPPGFGGAAIAPCLPALLKKFPELSAELDLSVRFVDLLGEGYDAAIRAAPLPDSDLACRKLAELPRVLCAAPDFLARIPAPSTPRDLQSLDCIAWRSPSAATYWPFLDETGRRFEVPVYGRFSTTTSAAEREAARAGLGVALMPASFIAEDFAKGSLVPVLEQARPAPLEIYLVWPPQKLLSVKLRALIDHLVEELAKPGVTFY